MIRPTQSVPRNARVRTLRWPLLMALAAILAIGIGAAWDRLPGRGDGPSLDPASLRAGFGPANYAAALARAESNLVGAFYLHVEALLLPRFAKPDFHFVT